ncbi:MAG: TonB-dependent receptor [Pseudoalteromonas distincta]
MRLLHHPLAWSVAMATLTCSAPAFAQTEKPLALDEVTVTASALNTRPTEMTTPVEVLRGDALTQRTEATLGDTLNGLPGVHASGFGPGVGRPVIRGLEGARVRVLSDGVDVMDASTISPDHAITTDTLLVEQIEVLKGPATLLYGGGAIGGVVNLIDRKVPTYVPEKGIEGNLHLRGNTVADERAGAVGVTMGAGQIAGHIEASKSEADPYRIPGNPSRQEGAFNDSESYSLGLSWIGERGYLGAAFSRQEKQYGLLAHEHIDCHTHHQTEWHCGGHGDHDDHDHDHEHEGDHGAYISMVQRRWDVRGEYADPFAGFELAKLRVSHTDYEHDEIEEGVVGTRFENQGTEARLELTHRPLHGWRGVVGGQTSRRDFSAEGEEDYLIPTLTRSHAVFLLEELKVGDWRYELGLRHDWQDIDANGIRAGVAAPDRSHSGTSASAGATWRFAPEYALRGSLSRSQRLPSAEELYAFGPHAATGVIEVGDPDLKKETGYNIEFGLSKLAGLITYDVSVYRNQISDFIYMADAGTDPGDGVREFEYRQRDAVLHGVEGVIGLQATDGLKVSLFGDRVRGKLKGDGNLPRIPASRLGVRFDQRISAGLSGQVEAYRVKGQSRIADDETSTSGYTMLGAGLSYRGQAGEDLGYLLYARANNLLDEKARQHSSFIKDEVLLPGRNLTVGVKFDF